jgi:hypothetical protein
MLTPLTPFSLFVADAHNHKIAMQRGNNSVEFCIILHSRLIQSVQFKNTCVIALLQIKPRQKLNRHQHIALLHPWLSNKGVVGDPTSQAEEVKASEVEVKSAVGVVAM